ncbi:MAG: hypothetical protein QOH59_134 [Gemmatimonadales bacterium]|jgi:hypothetical protein|nr:hypothetical protein [Gemmatimonadales bacterium]
MNFRARTAILAAACWLGVGSQAWGQTPTSLDSLRRNLSVVSARIDSLEAGLCPAEATPAALKPSGNTRADSLAATLDRLNRRVEAIRSVRCAASAQAQPADSTDDLAALRVAAAEAAGQAPSPSDTSKTGQTVPAEPAAKPAGGPRGANLLNPEISATGDVRLVGEEGVRGNNAVAHEFEFAFQAALDPYSSTKIFLSAGEDGVGVEEGYIYYAGLPGHLRLDLGKFREQVGDLNRWHAHALPETQYPLVYQRFLAEDGLTGVGVSLYTNLPFSLAGATHEVWFQTTAAESDPLLAGSGQLLFLGRLQNFWQLNRSTYAQLGFTGLGGNNAGADLRSRVIGADFRVTYRPPNEGTRRDITFRGEGYRLHASELGTTTNRYGAFLDLQARTSQRWILGARYDYVEAPRGLPDTEWRITPALTWWQSEFVYLRLEGEHRHTDLEGSRNMLTFQAVWAMGPHKHETY